MTGLSETLKLLFAVVIGIVLVIFISWVGDLRHQAEVGKQANKVLTTTEGMQRDGHVTQEVVHRFEVDLSNGNQEFTQRQVEGERKDENVAGRADGAVPDSVRDNFRQRRLARDRSQRAALERLGAPEATDAGEREDVLR